MSAPSPLLSTAAPAACRRGLPPRLPKHWQRSTPWIWSVAMPPNCPASDFVMSVAQVFENSGLQFRQMSEEGS